MSKQTVKVIEDRKRFKAAVYAASQLRMIGVLVDKKQPSNKYLIDKIIENGFIDKTILNELNKDVLLLYYEANKQNIINRRILIKEKKLTNKTKEINQLNNVKPKGYIQRCNKDEPINLNPSVFYKSWRWKEIRLIALDIYGRKCACCGSKPSSENNVVLHVDHIKPLRLNPELALDLTNLQVLCEDCNQVKVGLNKRLEMKLKRKK